jgi:hypothetical protein
LANRFTQALNGDIQANGASVSEQVCNCLWHRKDRDGYAINAMSFDARPQLL